MRDRQLEARRDARAIGKVCIKRGKKMHKKLLIVLLSLLSLMVIPFVVQAATITICTFDKDTYRQGQIGYITVTIYNDEDDKIRITELTATIDYYYTDGNIYLQSFFTNTTLPAEIQQGQSSTFYIPFSLPTNIASGYTDVYVKAKTELWDTEAERWGWSDHPTHQPTLSIESPYKLQSEDYEQQLDEQRAINKNTITMMYFFGGTAIVSAVLAVLLFILNRRARVISQPIV